MKTITKFIYPAFAVFAIACFALSPTAQAVTPAPDGGYPNENTAEGDDALFSLTSGAANTAVGSNALYFNTTGDDNVANGYSALRSNTTGYYNTTGNGNVAEGVGALQNNTGSFNTALGFNAGANLTTGSNNIDIGALGVAGESNTMRIGTVRQTATYIASIYNQTVASGVGVIIDSTGHLGTITSSAQFKEAIKPMEKVSETILALKPVTFHYKKEIDPEGVPQFGLVAEDVEKVNPDLVARDAQGKVYTVRYEAVNAMLLNEFLKEHRKVEVQHRKLQEQEATIIELKSIVAQQQKESQSIAAQQQTQIEALTTGLQKVSDQLELSKPAPQTVLNDQ